MKEFDAFLSHSSDDKLYFVRPLCEKLREYGAEIWYDEFALKPGVSLSRSIELGLSKSKYGIVVLSKSFFKKNWTEYELRALNSYEVTNPGIIIPLWLNVGLEEVRGFSPYLSDKLAIVVDTETLDIEDVAVQILEVIREDIFEKIQIRRVWDEIIKDANPIILSKDEFSKKIKDGPIRHQIRSSQLINRIRIIRSTFLEVFPDSFVSWLDGFERDIHPENEIQIWEKMATTYQEFIHYKEIEDFNVKKEIFFFILGFFNNSKETGKYLYLNDDDKASLKEFCQSPIPKADFLTED